MPKDIYGVHKYYSGQGGGASGFHWTIDQARYKQIMGSFLLMTSPKFQYLS